MWWVNCLRDQKKISICPLGFCPSSPSVKESQGDIEKGPHKEEGPCAEEAKANYWKVSFQLYLYSFCYDVHITFRVVCYEDYLKEHGELDDGNFEKHWNSRTKAEKKVQNILSMFYLVSCSIDINQALSIVARKRVGHIFVTNSVSVVALEVGFVKTLLAGSLVMHTSRLVD